MASMLPLSMIALGGASGAVCRYALAGHVIGKLFTDAEHPRFPWGVLAVNLLGCFAIGILAAVFLDRPAEDRLRFLLITGFLGSFTTFRAFGLDTFELFKANAITLALANAAACVIGGTALAAAS